MTPDELTPNTAPLVAEALGIGVGAYDVGAACTGWLSALSSGAALVETGRTDAVLVIGAETLSQSRTRTTSAPPRCSATAPAPSS